MRHTSSVDIRISVWPSSKLIWDILNTSYLRRFSFILLNGTTSECACRGGIFLSRDSTRITPTVFLFEKIKLYVLKTVKASWGNKTQITSTTFFVCKSGTVTHGWLTIKQDRSCANFNVWTCPLTTFYDCCFFRSLSKPHWKKTYTQNRNLPVKFTQKSLPTKSKAFEEIEQNKSNEIILKRPRTE